MVVGIRPGNTRTAKVFRVNNFNPTIDIDDTIIKLGESVSIQSISSVFDQDGDPIETYRFFNPAGGGFFTLNGVDMGAGSYFEVDAGDIAGVFYHAGSTVGFEQIRARVYDGGRWSPEITPTMYTVKSPTSRPVVNGVNSFDIVAFEQVRLTDYFDASDPDGYPLVRYKIRDSRATKNGGQIQVGNRKIGQSKWVSVKAEDIDTVFYNASEGKQSEEIQIRAYDGTKWSNIEKIAVNTTRNSNRPFVSTTSFTIRAETSVNLIDTFEVRDEDRSTMKSYRFLNTNKNGGYIEVNGVRKPSNRWVTITAAEMENAKFVAADFAIEQDVRVRAYDGKFWSRIKTIEFDSLPDPTLETNDGVILDEFEVIPITDLVVRQSDEGPRIVEYEFIDETLDPLSGYLELDGNRLAAGEIHAFSQAEFGRLNFVGGANHQRSWDKLKVRANNGSGVNNFFVGEWKNVNVYTEPNSFTSLARDNGTDDGLTSWEDFISRSPDGKLTITYSMTQVTPDYYLDGTGPDPPDGHDIPTNPNPNENQRRSMRSAMFLLGDMLDVNFVEVSHNWVDPATGIPGGVIRFSTYFDPGDPAAAFAYFPDDPGTAPWGGDIWVNNAFGPNVTSVGKDSLSYMILLHELGHALGMNHPFAIQSGKTVLSSQLDSNALTVMSYTPNPNGTNPRSPMSYDFEHLGVLYGKNPNTRTGDDVYSWNAVRFSDLVYDVDGIDTIDASNQTRGAVINLNEGQFSSIGFVDENVVIASGTVIENAIGTDQDDELYGNEADNILHGGNGHDVIHGAGGNDQYFGGAGNDRYIFKVGDQHNVINEEKKTGRDVLEVHMGETYGLDSFSEDISFIRNGRDLIIEFKTDGDDFRSGSVTVKDQKFAGSRVETFRRFDSAGNQIGDSIDLTSVFVQSDSTSKSFASTGVRGQYGFLVTPV